MANDRVFGVMCPKCKKELSAEYDSTNPAFTEPGGFNEQMRAAIELAVQAHRDGADGAPPCDGEVAWFDERWTSRRVGHD